MIVTIQSSCGAFGEVEVHKATFVASQDYAIEERFPGDDPGGKIGNVLAGMAAIFMAMS